MMLEEMGFIKNLLNVLLVKKLTGRKFSKEICDKISKAKKGSTTSKKENQMAQNLEYQKLIKEELAQIKVKEPQ